MRGTRGERRGIRATREGEISVFALGSVLRGWSGALPTLQEPPRGAGERSPPTQT